MAPRIDHGDFVELVYDAAVEPDLWPKVLAGFADMVGGDGAMLMWQNQLTGQGVGVTTRFDPKAPELFFGHYATRNPLRPPAEIVLRGLRDFVPQVITDEHRMAKGDLMRTEFYNDFMKPFDMHSTLSMGLAVEGDDAGTVDVVRPARRGPFSADDLRLSRRLQPHFVRAFELSRKLAVSRGAGQELAGVLDMLPHGVFLLGEGGRVRYANRAAERLLAEVGGLAMAGGGLVAGTLDGTRRLHALIGAAADPDRERRAGGSMALAVPPRRRPLSVSVTPAGMDYRSVFQGGPTVIVCVTDLEIQVSLPEQRLHDLFGLTRAEARVATALFEGLDPREAAGRLGLSFHTVRGHLMRIFEKTGARGQVELARLMMRAIGIGAG
ncbi:MAG: LuxR C-terminal-related transcriptional regulator [Caulobacteraceae bacterium]